MNEQTKKLMFSSETAVWATPKALFDKLSAKYGPFDLDVCALEDNAKCAHYFTPEDDGLAVSWSGPAGEDSSDLPKPRCWMNPPYGRHNGGIGAWVKKAYDESLNGCVVCCLLPVRTDTQWFHQYCLPYGSIEFLRGRVKFGGATSGAPFPSMVVVFGLRFKEASRP